MSLRNRRWLHWAVAAGLAAAACDRAPTEPPAPTPPAAAAVEIALPDSLPLLGATVKLTATVRDAKGDTLQGREVTWQSSDTTRVRVDSQGVISAVGLGSAVVTARSADVAASVSLRVVRPIRGFSTNLAPYVLPVGGTRVIVVDARDSAYAQVPDPQVVVASSDPGIIAVDGAGVLRAIAEGRVTITVRAENLYTSTQFHVVAGYAVVADLGTLGGPESRAFGINDAGDVVGDAQTATGEWHAFLHRDGKMIDVGPAGLASRAVASAGGSVVGVAFTAADTTTGVRPFLWRGGAAELLPVPAGAPTVFATDVNDRGTVVGYSTSPCSLCPSGRAGSALRWDDGVLTDLGRFGGHQAVATLVDESGRIAGGVEPALRGGWLLDGALVDLVPGIVTAGSGAGHLASAYGEHVHIWRDGVDHPFHVGIRTRATALGVDRDGRVLARTNYCTYFLPCVAEDVIRLPDDRRFGLNNILAPGTTWRVVAASAMNDDGMIVGYGRESADGPIRAILLRPRS